MAAEPDVARGEPSVDDLKRQLNEALQHQAATNELLEVIRRSASDFQSVLDALLAAAARLCGVEAGGVAIRDGEVFRYLATVGMNAEFDAVMRGRTYIPGRGTTVGRVALEKRVVHIVDAQADPDYEMSETITVGRLRSILSVPMMREGEVVGAITLARRQVEPFSERQIALIKTFADQAVIAMENARLLGELSEALDRQQATSEVLQVINASLGQLKPVFDALLEKATSFCEAAFGILWTYDGENYRAAALRKVPPAYAKYLREPPPLSPEAPLGRIAAGESLAHIPDMAVQMFERSPLMRHAVELGGFRTVLGVALRKEGMLLGAITIYRQEVRLFSDKQIALLQNFAAQAVIAMENARLLTEQHRALEQQKATSEVLAIISASPENLEPVFSTILSNAITLCQAELGNLFLFEDDTFRVAAMHGASPAYAQAWQQEPVLSIVGKPHIPLAQLATEKRVVHIPDLAKEHTELESDRRYITLFESARARTMLLVPMLKEDKLVGAIVIYAAEERPFDNDQIDLVVNFARQAVIAIENSRLLAEQREALERQTAMAEVLQVINSSPGDLAPVLDAMLEKATSLCAAAFGILWLCDGERFHAAALYGAPERYAEIARVPHRPHPSNPLGRMLCGERLITSLDVAAEEPYRTGDPVRRALVDVGRARSVIQVALVKDDVLLGSLTVYRQEVRPFSDKQIALLQNFAAQAVIAIENARLLAEQRESLERQTATTEVLEVINSSPGNLQPVFDAMLDRAVRLSESAFGIMNLYEDGGYRAVALHGVPPDMIEQWSAAPPPGPQNALTRLVNGEDVVHIEDLATSPSYQQGDPRSRSLVEIGGARSLLAVALRKDGKLLGSLTAYRQEPRPFLQKQIKLLQGFAAQAVIATENARLISEQREALERQTATTEVLEVINSSPGNLAPVFETMLEKAMRSCEASYGMLYIYEGGVFRAVALHAVPSAFANFLREPIKPDKRNALGRLASGEKLVHIEDIRADPAYLSGEPVRVATVELGGARTYLGVPLRKDDTLLGIIGAYRQEVRPFSDKQVALLQSFATQAVIAMENARLLGELREALDQQTATAEVLQVINSSPGDLTPVFETMLEKAMTLCGAAFGFLTSYDGQRFTPVAMRGVPPPLADYFSHGMDQPRPGEAHFRILEGEDVIHNLDQKDEEAYHSGLPLRRAVVDLGGARTALVVALRKDDVVLGALTFYRKEVRPFSDKQVALIRSFAAQAVIAIENARLLNEQGEALERQTATADVLQVISASPGNLAPVFDAILEKAMVLCQAAFGQLGTYDGQRFHIAATRGLPAAYDAYLKANPLDFGPGTGPARLLAGESCVHVIDAMASDAYQAGERNRRALVDLGGAHTLLNVALRKDDVLLGWLAIYRREVRPFSDKQIALVQDFASQGVIAIENARLLEEIRQRQAELRVTFDNMGDGVAMFDDDHRLAAWNRNFQEIMNLSEDWLAARPTYADYLGLLAERGEFGTENVEAELAGRLEHTERELRLERTRADGSVIEVRRNAVPGGSFVLIYSDVTERRQAEAAVRAARDAAEAALERQTATADILKVIASSPTDVEPVLAAVVKAAVRFCGTTDAMILLRDGDSVMSLVHEGPLTYNADDRRSLDRSTVGGRAIVDARTCHVPDIEAIDPAEFVTARRLAALHGFRAVVGAPLKREDTAIGAVVLRKAEPGPFTLQQIALLETFAAQAVIAIENVRLFTELKDSLERLKAAQANLIQSEKMASLGQLTAGIAHEIKNPLNFVNNFAGLSVELMNELKEVAEPVLAGMSKDARAEFGETIEMITSNLDKIAEHGKRADGIVKSMLSHSRGGTGDWQVSNINALVEEALNLAYHGARAQDNEFNVTLERDFDPESKPIELVPQDVTRVFLNLFGNGFYAANKRRLGNVAGYRPSLKVSTRDLGDAVEIRVRDNGTGIPPEVRDKLFQPFFTTKPTGEGTGLGLSISYDIVSQQHGGSIDVESEPGAFTEFTVRLPRRRRAA